MTIIKAFGKNNNFLFQIYINIDLENVNKGRKYKLGMREARLRFSIFRLQLTTF